MASLIFAQAKSIYLKANKDRTKWEEQSGDPDGAQMIFEETIKIERARFKSILRLAIELHEDYKEISKQNGEHHYFITIRPKEGVKFESFYSKVYEYINRRPFKKYTLSFEQKGIEGEDLGHGFHCHIVASTTWLSKGQCLRDTINSFKSFCEQNCIQVDRTYNPEAIIEGYLTKYESEDKHKELTKESDYTWRMLMKLKDLYTSDEPLEHPKTRTTLSIKSNRQSQIIEFG